MDKIKCMWQFAIGGMSILALGLAIGYGIGSDQETQPVGTKAGYLKDCFDSWGNDTIYNTKNCISKADAIFGDA